MVVCCSLHRSPELRVLLCHLCAVTELAEVLLRVLQIVSLSHLVHHGVGSIPIPCFVRRHEVSIAGKGGLVVSHMLSGGVKYGVKDMRLDADGKVCLRSLGLPKQPKCGYPCLPTVY
jgi:hypothetical protein